MARTDHVVLPLDDMHAGAVAAVAGDLASVLGLWAPAPCAPHVTLLSYRGLARGRAVAALRPVADRTAPFVVRAHGYGIFAGDGPDGLSLHVMVVRTGRLDRLHTEVRAALLDAGATLDGLTEPAVWSPHVTLVRAGLSPERLGRAVEHLAGRPHHSWALQVASLEVSRPDGRTTGPPLRLGARMTDGLAEKDLRPCPGGARERTLGWRAAHRGGRP